MSTGASGRNKLVYISCSPDDISWVERLQPTLDYLARDYQVASWSTEKINPGDDSLEERRRARDAATHAVLVLSTEYLASELIRSEELPALLDAASRAKLVMLPLIVRPCPYSETEGISRFKPLNRPDRPLSKYPGDVDDIFKELARMVI